MTPADWHVTEEELSEGYCVRLWHGDFLAAEYFGPDARKTAQRHAHLPALVGFVEKLANWDMAQFKQWQNLEMLQGDIAEARKLLAALEADNANP